MILSQNSQYFIDEIEDFIIHWLSQEVGEDAKLIASLPKVLHFCAHSPKAYGSLEEILVAYAQESNYDTRLMSLISELVAKVHQIAAKQGGKFETGLSQEKFSYD